MRYQVVAYSPEGHPIRMGLGTTRPEHALDDRDELRHAYLRNKEQGWRVEAEDADGRRLEWKDVETSPTAGAQ